MTKLKPHELIPGDVVIMIAHVGQREPSNVMTVVAKRESLTIPAFNWELTTEITLLTESGSVFVSSYTHFTFDCISR